MSGQAVVKGIGFSTNGQRGDLADLDAALGRIEDAGADYAELTLCAEDLVVDGRLLTRRVDRLERICARRKLAYTVHGPICINLMDTENLALHRAAARAYVELCAVVGAESLVTHTGRVPGAPADVIDRLLAQERSELRELGELAGPHDVRIAVENLFVETAGQFTCDPFELARHLAAVDHPAVGGLIDFSHAYLMCRFKGLAYAEALRALAPATRHVHVHDSFGRPVTIGTFSAGERLAYGQGDLHLPLGWGGIPWDEVMPGLPLRPGTSMIIELPPRWQSEMAECLAEARRLARLLETDPTAAARA